MNKAKKNHLLGSNKKEDLRMKPVMPAENLEIDENSTEKYTPPEAGVKQRQPSQNRNKNNSANPGGSRQ